MNLKQKDYNNKQYSIEIQRRRLTGKCVNCLSDNLDNLTRIKRDNILVHRGHCYRGYDQSHRERFNINNRSNYNSMRVKNLNYYKMGKQGKTGMNYKHSKTIGINPVQFYNWLNKLSDTYGYNNRLIGTDRIPIDHFIPLAAGNLNNYDKNKWYNLRPITKAENKLRKNNMPDFEDISDFIGHIEQFKNE